MAGLAEVGGWFACSADGELAPPIDAAAIDRARQLTAETMVMAGVTVDDRVAVALNNDGAGVGMTWAEAASTVAQASCSVGPRQTRRLLRIIRSMSASVLITTPTIARRISRDCRDDGTTLAELGLSRLIVTGEIADDRDLARLTDLSGAAVAEMWLDPVYGVAMASRRPAVEGSFTPTRPGLLDVEPLDPSVQIRLPEPAGEWLVHPVWVDGNDGPVIRTGVVSDLRGHLRAPRWTIGDHLLVRGRWLSVPELVDVTTSALGSGPGTWTAEVARHVTGDRVELLVEGASPTTLDTLRAALAAALPIHVAVAPATARGRPDEAGPVRDRRGQHLGARTVARG